MKGRNGGWDCTYHLTTWGSLFLFVSNWCSDFKSIIAVQPNNPDSCHIQWTTVTCKWYWIFFFIILFLNTWFCVCSVLTLVWENHLIKNYFGLCMTVQYNLNCRMIMLPHFPTFCFSVDLLNTNKLCFASPTVLDVEIEMFYCKQQSWSTWPKSLTSHWNLVVPQLSEEYKHPWNLCSYGYTLYSIQTTPCIYIYATRKTFLCFVLNLYLAH